MAKKKTTTGNPDRHKPRRLVGIPEPLCEILDELCREEMRSFTEQVRTAIVEYLKSINRWPPKK